MRFVPVAAGALMSSAVGIVPAVSAIRFAGGHAGNDVRGEAPDGPPISGSTPPTLPGRRLRRKLRIKGASVPVTLPFPFKERTEPQRCREMSNWAGRRWTLAWCPIRRPIGCRA